MMPPRILVDVSAQLRADDPSSNLIRGVEREIARRLLEDASLLSLPFAFRDGAMYAVGWDRAAALRRGARRHALQAAGTLATTGALALIGLAPARKRRDLVQRLDDARSAILARVSRATEAGPGVVGARLSLGNLLIVIEPARADILWVCDPYFGFNKLRWLAAAKPSIGFRVASICYGVHSDLFGLAGDVVLTRTIDQLDASDLIFCSSMSVQTDLRALAMQHNHPSPDTRLLPLEEWDTSAAIVKEGMLSLVQADQRST